MKNYDSKRNDNKSAYANMRIWGQMINHVRRDVDPATISRIVRSSDGCDGDGCYRDPSVKSDTDSTIDDHLVVKCERSQPAPPDATAGNAESRSKLRDSLPDDQLREIFDRHFVSGEDRRRIAASMEIPHQSVSGLINAVVACLTSQYTADELRTLLVA